MIGKHDLRTWVLVRDPWILVGHGWEPVIVFLDVKLNADTDLAQVADTGCGFALFLRPAQSRQQEGRKDSDNGDDDEEFDEGEGSRAQSACDPSPASACCPAHLIRPVDPRW
jgi:hypothetical protein